MPSGPIGSVWKSGSWSDTAWEANTWANAAATPAGGQSPAATRSRMQAAAHTVIRGFILWIVMGGGW